jgi:quinoprotein glucose dehydrogenase
MQLGGPYLPPSYNRLRVQFPGNHGGANWGGTSFNPQLGYLFVNTNELGQITGLRDRDPKDTGPARGDGQGHRVDPDGPYQGVPGRRTLQGQRLEHDVPAAAVGTADRRQRQYR